MAGSRFSIVTTLIIANVAIFVFQELTGGAPPRNLELASPIFRLGVLHTPSVLHGQVWRLITANYLHWTFGHILMNMIGLHFLGRPLERDWGPKRFFAIYTIAGLLGSVFYLMLSYAGWLSLHGVAAGASGCVLGLLGACAVRYPHAEVLIYFLFPIKIRTAAFLFGGWYVLNLVSRGSNAGGDACHLAGMGFGVWWAMMGETWWGRLRSASFKLRGSATTQAPGARAPRPSFKFPRLRRAGGFAAKLAQRREDEETIDRILRKVHDGGIHSLSDAEKRALQEATSRQQEREKEAGRVDRL